MDLSLSFLDGVIYGEGTDDVGAFLIHGRYDAASRECDWVKTYPGSHQVNYHGFREGKGIWGRWDIGLFGHGGFHIWPLGEGCVETAVEKAGAGTVPKEVESPTGPARKPEELNRLAGLDPRRIPWKPGFGKVSAHALPSPCRDSAWESETNKGGRFAPEFWPRARHE